MLSSIKQEKKITRVQDASDVSRALLLLLFPANIPLAVVNEVYNRVVHSWHFSAIFHSIFQSFSWFPLLFSTFLFHSHQCHHWWEWKRKVEKSNGNHEKTSSKCAGVVQSGLLRIVLKVFWDQIWVVTQLGHLNCLSFFWFHMRTTSCLFKISLLVKQRARVQVS